MLGKNLRRDFFNSFENNVNLLVCLLLMMFQIEYSLEQLFIVIDELRYHGESTHNTDIDPHGSFGFQYTAEHGDAVAGEGIRSFPLPSPT